MDFDYEVGFMEVSFDEEDAIRGQGEQQRQCCSTSWWGREKHRGRSEVIFVDFREKEDMKKSEQVNFDF